MALDHVASYYVHRLWCACKDLPHAHDFEWPDRNLAPSFSSCVLLGNCTNRARLHCRFERRASLIRARKFNIDIDRCDSSPSTLQAQTAGQIAEQHAVRGVVDISPLTLPCILTVKPRESSDPREYALLCHRLSPRYGRRRVKLLISQPMMPYLGRVNCPEPTSGNAPPPSLANSRGPLALSRASVSGYSGYSGYSGSYAMQWILFSMLMNR